MQRQWHLSIACDTRVNTLETPGDASHVKFCLISKVFCCNFREREIQTFGCRCIPSIKIKLAGPCIKPYNHFSKPVNQISYHALIARLLPAKCQNHDRQSESPIVVRRQHNLAVYAGLPHEKSANLLREWRVGLGTNMVTEAETVTPLPPISTDI